jgi:hydrogenase-4 component B
MNSLTLFWIMIVVYIGGVLFSLIFGKKPRIASIGGNLFFIAAALFGIFTVIHFMLSPNSKELVLLNLSSGIPLIQFTLKLDRLTSFFILPLSILTLATAIYSPGYLKTYDQHHYPGLFNMLFGLFVLSIITVLCAGNLIAFLIAWELMSLVSFFLVIFEDEERGNRRAAFTYLIMTHLASAFLIIAFALLYKYTGSINLTASPAALPAFIKNILFGCFLIGFCTKAGIVPLHIWLPLAHPAAPSNVSALMSGIMIKTAIYGLLRFALIGLGTGQYWWGTLLLTLGLVSMLIGVAYALIESNFKRLLAYSSIDNIGIIFIGLGVAFWGKSTGSGMLLALGLTAALVHLFNHSIFKGLLFLGAGAVNQATGTKELEELGGLVKKMPQTALLILTGCLAAAALPPFNGFIGEWLTFQALLASIVSPALKSSFPVIVTIAGMGLAGAMAVGCFVKLFGIAFLGSPRTKCAEKARESSGSMRFGAGLLAALSLVLGIFPILLFKALGPLVSDLSGIPVITEFFNPGLGLVIPLDGLRSNIAPLPVAVTLVLLIWICWVVIKMISRKKPQRIYATWDCGFESLTTRMQYSATGFSKPFRIIFRGLFRPDRELHVKKSLSPYHQESLQYIVSTESVFEKYLYRPVYKKLTSAAIQIKKRVQTGSVHTYLIYIFVMIVLLMVYYICN